MAHFAKIDENNIVIEVIVVDNSDIIDDTGQESEQQGIAFCQMLHGPGTSWKQTSYSGNYRGIFASIGMRYDPEQDIFVAPPLPPRPTILPDPTRRFFEHI